MSRYASSARRGLCKYAELFMSNLVNFCTFFILIFLGWGIFGDEDYLFTFHLAGAYSRPRKIRGELEGQT